METPQQLTEQIINDLSNKFDEIFIEGLRLKGYSFDTLEQTMSFVKEYCRSAISLPMQQTTYYIKDIPFLWYDYSQTLEPINESTGDIKIKATYGSYKYL